MSIYSDYKVYARQVRITERMAKIWCEHQIKVRNEVEKAKKCPKCGNHTLAYEGGSYEENIRDYIYCEFDEWEEIDEDGETYFTECPYSTLDINAHEPLQPWYDFDVILAQTELIIKFEGLKAWFDYAKSEINDVIQRFEQLENRSMTNMHNKDKGYIDNINL